MLTNDGKQCSVFMYCQYEQFLQVKDLTKQFHRKIMITNLMVLKALSEPMIYVDCLWNFWGPFNYIYL